MKPGDFVWYELMTSDVPAAQAFYAKVVGWTVADSGMPGMRYMLAKTGDRQVAGIMDVPPDAAGAPLRWFGYILVEDVDAMATRVTAAGGRLHRAPMDIPGIGRFAVVADPQGAVFMLFKGAGTPPPELVPNTPGTIGWHELHARDGKEAFSFYLDLFGWTAAYAHDMGAMGVYQTFNSGDAWTGGMMSSPSEEAPYWLYYFTVDDIDAAAARIAEAGGKVLSGPHQVPGGSWVLSATDPQGIAFALTGSRP